MKVNQDKFNTIKRIITLFRRDPSDKFLYTELRYIGELVGLSAPTIKKILQSNFDMNKYMNVKGKKNEKSN